MAVGRQPLCEPRTISGQSIGPRRLPYDSRPEVSAHRSLLADKEPYCTVEPSLSPLTSIVFPQRNHAISPFSAYSAYTLVSKSQRGSPIRHERHRAPRYPFIATLELTDVESEKQLTARTRDLNLFGCFAESQETFPADTKVRLRILRSGLVASVLGKVVYVRPGSGMGIQFVTIEPNSLPIFEDWLASLRS